MTQAGSPEDLSVRGWTRVDVSLAASPVPLHLIPRSDVATAAWALAGAHGSYPCLPRQGSRRLLLDPPHGPPPRSRPSWRPSPVSRHFLG